jgi:eukaryotic-like serine/threonine-protein kinase
MEEDVKIGDVLDAKYRVERVLGAGGMGAVVLATHLDLNELRAVKYILPSGRGNQVLVERFLREARASIKLKSEHVVRVFDVGRFQSGEPYMVMEYLQGCDLDELLQTQGPLPQETAIDCMLQAMEAIAEAHRRGIIHRDLKPANLFLAETETGDRVVKVLDFGISKLTGELAAGQGMDMTKTATMMGSPYFMSPEQMRSTKDVDQRTDLWSLGVIAYQLLSGKLPFNGESITALCASVFTEEPQALQLPAGQVPPGLSQAIMYCLAKRPEERFQSVIDFATALAPFGGPHAAYRLQRIAAQSQQTTTTGSHVPAAGSHAQLSAQGASPPGAPQPLGSQNGASQANVSAGPAASPPQVAAAHTAGAFSQSTPQTPSPNNGKRSRLLMGLAVLGMGAAAAVALAGLIDDDEPDTATSGQAARATAGTAETAAPTATSPATATSPSATASAPQPAASASAAPSASASTKSKTPKTNPLRRRRRRQAPDVFGDGRH